MELQDTIIAMTAIILGSMIFLIPIAGITARIALKPVLEAMARYRGVETQKEALALLERRLALMEDQVSGVDRAVRELLEDADFRRQLEGGAPRGRAAIPAESEGERAL